MPAAMWNVELYRSSANSSTKPCFNEKVNIGAVYEALELYSVAAYCHCVELRSEFVYGLYSSIKNDYS